jgi:hypothetical protein
MTQQIAKANDAQEGMASGRKFVVARHTCKHVCGSSNFVKVHIVRQWHRACLNLKHLRSAAQHWEMRHPRCPVSKCFGSEGRHIAGCAC